MGDAGDSSESHSLRGPIDRPALLTIRDLINRTEPLATAELDDYLDPTHVAVRFEDGIADADSCRIDVQWTTCGDYKFHYTDAAGVDCRWGNHPHDGDYVTVSGTAHFHPPPDATSDPRSVADSCIGHTTAVLVTRAVLKLWRVAYDAADPAVLNAGSNPP